MKKKKKITDEEMRNILDKLIGSYEMFRDEKRMEEDVLLWARRGIAQINGVYVKQEENKLTVIFKNGQTFIVTVDKGERIEDYEPEPNSLITSFLSYN